MYRRVIKVLDVQIELLSSFPLIHAENYFSQTDVESLLSDYGAVEDVAPTALHDGTIVIMDAPGTPMLSWQGDMAVARGPFAALEEHMKDKRYTLLGNQGLLYRFILHLLEKKHGIYSFHANALYHEGRNELFVVFGGAASGKSPALLAGLCNGLKVMGTELVHFSVTEGVYTFYRSSSMDNVRPSCVSEDFPELLGVLDVPDTASFHSPSSKFLLNMHGFSASAQRLISPRLRLVVPKVEAGRNPVIEDLIKDKGVKIKTLFDNLSEKVSASFTMYNQMACNGFDTPELAQKRLTAATQLLEAARWPHVEQYIAAPRHFLEVLK